MSVELRIDELNGAEDWRPLATMDMLHLRARLLGEIRAYFSECNVLEVETPILCEVATSDPNIDNFTTRYTGPGAPHGQTRYLHTSPESAMKRLLAAGSGAIYQICKVFRDGETGKRHNPEFTMLEWYRPGYDHHALMHDVESLVTRLLQFSSCNRWTYAEAFERFAGINPHSATVEDIKACIRQYELTEVSGLAKQDRDAWLDLILTHIIEPELGQSQPVFIYDYPVTQAAFARVRDDNYPVAERFELYIKGIEIANGYHELLDKDEQWERVEKEREKRQLQSMSDVMPDRRLFAALGHGLPSCSGVALGIDRLLMIAANVSTIQETLAFDVNNS